MKNYWLIWVFCFFFLAGCEDIYNPELKTVDAMLVVEGRIVYGQGNQVVKLYKTIGFQESGTPYPPVKGAEIFLTDVSGNKYPLDEAEDGTYRLTSNLERYANYRLVIRAEGETYESSFQSIPEVPALDTAYLVPGEQLMVTGTDESAGNLQKTEGAWLNVDIAGKGDTRHYRFTSRKICQYSYNTLPPSGPPMEVVMYAWLSMTPWQLFNIAAPPQYSVSEDVRKHPVVFLEKSYRVQIPDTATYFMGWICIFNQYALSEQAWQYYDDLNSQLSAEGKLFDPLYTQAAGNMKCVTDPGKVILGNFEITSVREHRYFVWHQGNDNYSIKRIPYFYTIPRDGKQSDVPPVWWEYPGKEYPGGSGGQ